MKMITIFSLVAFVGCAQNVEPIQTSAPTQQIETKTGQQTPQDLSVHGLHLYFLNGHAPSKLIDGLTSGRLSENELAAATQTLENEVVTLSQSGPGTHTQNISFTFQLWGDSASSGAQADSRGTQQADANQRTEAVQDIRAAIEAAVQLQAALQAQQSSTQGQATEGSTASTTSAAEFSAKLDAVLELLRGREADTTGGEPETGTGTDEE